MFVFFLYIWKHAYKSHGQHKCPVQGKGRRLYLQRRGQIRPEEKFDFPLLSSWEYGWRLGEGDSRLPGRLYLGRVTSLDFLLILVTACSALHSNAVCLDPQVTTHWITEPPPVPSRLWWRTPSTPGTVCSALLQLPTRWAEVQPVGSRGHSPSRGTDGKCVVTFWTLWYCSVQTDPGLFFSFF